MHPDYVFHALLTTFEVASLRSHCHGRLRRMGRAKRVGRADPRIHVQTNTLKNVLALEIKAKGSPIKYQATKKIIFSFIYNTNYF